MNNRDLREFIGQLAARGELHHVAAEVDPELEIAAITNRVCKSRQNKALLFESVRGSSYRAATNLFGSEQRMSLALGIDRLADLTGRFDRLLGKLAGKGSVEKLAALTGDPCWTAAAPQMCEPPLHLHEAAIDLNLLPILKVHPLDGQPCHGGRFLTLPIVITATPDFSETNCGMYRAAVVAADMLTLKWGSRSGAADHADSWNRCGLPMPVAIAVGGPPALTFAATLPLPAALDEFTFAGLLQEEPVKTFRCANGLIAPLDAEVVIEGYLAPAEPVGSGAFGNHTGFYTPSEPAAALQVTAIRVRRDLILPSTVVGRPPMEDCWLARAGGCLLLSLLKTDVPELVDAHYPLAGIFHGAAFISVKNAQGRGPELIAAIRSTPWFAGSKLLVIVDEEQDPAEESGVLWQIMNSVHWSSDVMILDDKISIDATRKPCDTRTAVSSDPDLVALIESRWKEYGFED